MSSMKSGLRRDKIITAVAKKREISSEEGGDANKDARYTAGEGGWSIIGAQLQADNCEKGWRKSIFKQICRTFCLQLKKANICKGSYCSSFPLCILDDLQNHSGTYLKTNVKLRYAAAPTADWKPGLYRLHQLEADAKFTWWAETNWSTCANMTKNNPFGSDRWAWCASS